jgi:hypothetical protein
MLSGLGFMVVAYVFKFMCYYLVAGYVWFVVYGS